MREQEVEVAHGGRAAVQILPWGDGERTLAMLCRLDSVRKDSTGWMATFYGKPDVHDNCFTIPVSVNDAESLEPGKQYLFELTGMARR